MVLASIPSLCQWSALAEQPLHPSDRALVFQASAISSLRALLDGVL